MRFFSNEHLLTIDNPDTIRVRNRKTAGSNSVKDARAVERWIAGSEPYKGVEERLRFAYRLAKMISDHEGSRVVQAWFTGLNPELNDRVPVRLLREENLESVGPEILGAARAFLAGG